MTDEHDSCEGRNRRAELLPAQPAAGHYGLLTVVQRLVNLKVRDTPSLPDGGHPLRGSNYIIKGIRQERLANFGNKGALIRIIVFATANWIEASGSGGLR